MDAYPIHPPKRNTLKLVEELFKLVEELPAWLGGRLLSCGRFVPRALQLHSTPSACQGAPVVAESCCRTEGRRSGLLQRLDVLAGVV